VLFLTDENIEGRLLIQLRANLPELDILDVREIGLDQTPDEEILQWAADNGRVVISHDVNTMRGLADDRVRNGLPMPGLILVLDHISYRTAIRFITQYAESESSHLQGRSQGHSVFAKDVDFAQ
jgi:predicted nuclease of predicted toxin-antitoxin system